MVAGRIGATAAYHLLVFLELMGDFVSSIHEDSRADVQPVNFSSSPLRGGLSTVIGGNWSIFLYTSSHASAYLVSVGSQAVAGIICYFSEMIGRKCDLSRNFTFQTVVSRICGKAPQFPVARS
ncbi:hypothetical protein F5880DRAFT_1048613 [Lentinula raphanica]|nr:hypothetical protein F5880DRAFT_1048613 [Lentinula raphanica]